jgi:caffeoyl-CoA O-methyltransferase
MIKQYIAGLLPERNALLLQLEMAAKEEKIPILQAESVQFLRLLLKIINPLSILEIGTAIGYSTLHMAEAAANARIITLEIDPERARRARLHFSQAKVADRVEVIEGDALETIPRLKQSFDFVFLDAAKGKYADFFDLVFPLLAPGGVLLADNVLFRGMVALDDDEIDKKYKNMVRKLKKFNRLLVTHPQLDTSFVPVGDGLAISRKRGESICHPSRNCSFPSVRSKNFTG